MIYRLVQVARAVRKQFTNSLQKIGFSKCPADNCLMMRINKIGITILCIYVDNVCMFGNQEAVKATIKQIKSIYSIKRVGTLKEFIYIKQIESIYSIKRERTLTEFIGINNKIKDDDLFLGQEDTLKINFKKVSPQ